MRSEAVVVVLLMLASVAREARGDLKEECSNVIEKVVVCLDFATGKAAAPSKECCDSVKDMRDSNPGCLCLIIQQTHSGSPQIKSFGIQEPKLLQLPSACALKNSNVTDCPKLLGLPANSPDAAIFNGSATPAAPKSTAGPNGGSSASKLLVRHYSAGLAAVATAIFLIAFRLPTP